MGRLFLRTIAMKPQLIGAAIALSLTLVSPINLAHAQSKDPYMDYFGDNDDDEAPERPKGTLSPSDQAAQAVNGKNTLFNYTPPSASAGVPGANALPGSNNYPAPGTNPSGAGGYVPQVPNSGYAAYLNGTQPTPVPTPGWGNFNDISDDKYNDNYDKRMKDEINKPLPKHDPFGDRLDEIGVSLKPKQR